jgi:hypothetical protein
VVKNAAGGTEASNRPVVLPGVKIRPALNCCATEVEPELVVASKVKPEVLSKRGAGACVESKVNEAAEPPITVPTLALLTPTIPPPESVAPILIAAGLGAALLTVDVEPTASAVEPVRVWPGTLTDVPPDDGKKYGVKTNAGAKAMPPICALV